MRVEIRYKSSLAPHVFDANKEGTMYNRSACGRQEIWVQEDPEKLMTITHSDDPPRPPC
jgi:hypothetical protein